MSRGPPFPTISSRRPRSPATFDSGPAGPSYNPSSNGLPPTQPLSISRPRPRTPSDASSTQPSYAGGLPPAQPLRPARSERRPRQPPSIAGYDIPPSSYAQPSGPSSQSQNDPYGNGNANTNGNGGYGSDSGYRTPGRQSPAPGAVPSRYNNAAPPPSLPRDRSNTMNTQSSRRTEDDPYGGMDYASSPTSGTESPKALNTVIAALHHAGASARRKNTGGSEGLASEREWERQREKERREKTLLRERKARGKATGGIDDVLEDVEKDWPEVVEDEFNPVPLALALLDSSSLGRDPDLFHSTQRSLERTLKGSVDKNYKSFNQALALHANLLSALTKAQGELSEARTQLTEARDALGNKHGDLVQLWSRGQSLDEMMRLLDEIEKLKNVPDILESLISEKRLLQAAVLLTKSMKTISKPDMQDIGAVSDLRIYLTTQEASLRDILIEELHSHLYLKAFWCDRRWSPYTPNQTTLPVSEFDKLPGTTPNTLYTSTSSSTSSRMDLFLNHLALRPTNESPIDLYSDISSSFASSSKLPTSSSTLSASSYLPTSESLDKQQTTEPDSQNPESDSFTYIENVLEALAVLGKLVGALDTVIQRMPLELYSLVEGTIEEVNERSEYLRRTTGIAGVVVATSASSTALSQPSASAQASTSTSTYIFAPDRKPTDDLITSLRLTALEASTKATDHETLRDLFWTLFSKLDAVIQGFRVTFEVSNRIGKRRDFKDGSGMKPSGLFPLTDIWAALSSEVNVLLRDYLRDDDQLSIAGRNPIASINDVLRSNIRAQENAKAVYRFVDTDAKIAAKLLKKQDDELSRVLKETVPGLVTAAPAAEASSQLTGPALLDERGVGSAGQHHRILIPPDALHVTVLFQPTFAWLDRVQAILPSSMSVSLTDVQMMLDSFVLEIYLPQLEEKVQSLFQESVSAPDAFHEDPGWKKLATAPLIKAITSLVALVNSICAMMRITPFHHENYSRLVLSVLMQFYQRCSDRFQSLTTKTTTVPGVMADPSDFLTPAAWAQEPDLVKCLVRLRATLARSEESTARDQLFKEELRLELASLGPKQVTVSDTLGSSRTASSLANLYQSLVWFATQLSNLRSVTEDPESPTEADQLVVPPSARSPFMPKFTPPVLSNNNELKLPLSRAMVMRLDSLLKIYEQLSEIVLFTIRTDIRCRAMLFLQRGLREDLYVSDQEALDPDSYITSLNAELASLDDATSLTLGPSERQFIFAGLGHLVEHLLISEARHIRSANVEGMKKMLRNITALRQGLKSIDAVDPNDASLDAARAYFSLFPLGAEGLMEYVKAQESSLFTFEEYKVMLSLQSGVDPADADSLPAGAAGDFAINVIELQTICVE